MVSLSGREVIPFICLVASRVVVQTRTGDRGGKKDRKSTRLNSSHLGISYAVFCLKKKNKNKMKPLSQTKESSPHKQPRRHKPHQERIRKTQIITQTSSNHKSHQTDRIQLTRTVAR